MTADYHPYHFVAIFIAVAFIFPFVPLGLAWVWARLVSPQKTGQQKNAIYECGLQSTGSTAIRFKSEYYLYAIIFLIFDVEAVFLLPFAVAFLDLPLGAALAMLVFLMLLVEGLAWAWLKGLLTWR